MERNKIKLLIMDVDGTLTDGTINIGNNGELFKAFSVKDGHGIRRILPTLGIAPVIITGRNSDIVKYRAKEIGVEYLFQGSDDKVNVLGALLQQLGLTFDNCAYIGDDLNDYECMIKCRIKGCPHDAVKEIKAISDYVTERNGGQGAVREFIEYLASICQAK